MKRIFTLLAFVAITLGSFAYDVELNGIYYDLNSRTKEATVTYGTYEYSGSVTIPSTISYANVIYSVNMIGDNAFEKCTSLSQVFIPESVKIIGKYAFSGCEMLVSVNIPNSIAEIKERTFYGCYNLSSINISNTLLFIGAYAFADCKKLSKIDIPTSVDTIGEAAFAWAGITSIEIHNKVKKIGWGAFAFCENLQSAKIGTGISKIEWMTFEGCYSLNSIEFTNSLLEIDGYAFRYCYNLSSIIIPNSVITIGTGAFDECCGLKDIYIGSSLKDIGNCPFSMTKMANITVSNENQYYCAEDNVLFNKKKSELIRYLSDKSNYSIPKTVTKIAPCAFYYSTISSIKIPSSIDSIGYNAFKDQEIESVFSESMESWCNINFENEYSNPIQPGRWVDYGKFYVGEILATDIVIPSTIQKIKPYTFARLDCIKTIVFEDNVTEIGEGAFKYCDNISSITFPNSLTSIDNQAFAWCVGIESIIIPKSITEIGSAIFYGCNKLNYVTCFAENVPQTPANVFMSSSINTATLYVPEASLEAYKTTAPWSEFGTILPIETPAAINILTTDENGNTYYDLSGRNLSAPQHRKVNIVSGRKIYIK